MSSRTRFPWRPLAALVAALALAPFAEATPSNKAALERHYDRLLSRELSRCTTCHRPSAAKDPETLDDFPHNPFGDRLRVLGEASENKNLVSRLAAVAAEDSDGDGVDNEGELLAGTNPGDALQTPDAGKLASLPLRREELRQLLARYRWRPFDPVVRPAVPTVPNAAWARHPIDAFIAAGHEEAGLQPRPAAAAPVLLRRVYLDLIGLTPTPEEQRSFLADPSPQAYKELVDRLLADPRHGERWARHWMDIWRYSDWAGWTDGKQVRDSQRHIWRWRDWIVEALNADKPYDRMLHEMLAGDELAPEDPATLRATGFLVRNFKLLSREQWLEDTVKHTAQAVLGVTLGCAKCHDHLTDPITQAEYYEVRAIFEPHQVRTDRVPGELDLAQNGLPRVYDVVEATPTYFFLRGDERRPDKNRQLLPGTPRALGGGLLSVQPVKLPVAAAAPDRREFVVNDLVAASDRAFQTAFEAAQKPQPDPDTAMQRALECTLAAANAAALRAELAAEKLEDAQQKETPAWKEVARATAAMQRSAAWLAARKRLQQTQAALAVAQKRVADTAAGESAATAKATADLAAAQKKHTEAEQAFAKADEAAQAELTASYKPRPAATFPQTSTGRRTAFARWITQPKNPLTARVAMNHLWLRHFARGLSNTPENLGNGGARPSHPALLDWLASEFMQSGWSMKKMHRLIVTSNTYRQAATTDENNAARDPDNIQLWRMPSRPLEAELVRDNVLYTAGILDTAMGGPDIDHAQGLTSRRRSLYLQTAAEKSVEFLQIFNGPSVNECYQRHPTIMPQQALALSNSELTQNAARILAAKLTDEAGPDDATFTHLAYQRVLARLPSPAEKSACQAYLKEISPERARASLVAVLFNHHDFLTVR